MNLSTGWIALAAVLALLMGLWLMLAGQGMRRRRGLGAGKTVSLDNVTLRSPRLGLVGKPDRIIKAAGSIIVEEWKSSRKLRPSHRAQMGVYFLLIEDQLRVRPTHGFIVCGNGSRHRIDNTEDLQAWVLAIAGQIREARKTVTAPIAVNPFPAQCRSCGQRGNCGQARA